MKYIIKVNCMVKHDVLDTIRRCILRDLDREGVVILPPNFEVISVPDDAEITVEPKEVDDGSTDT